MATPTLDPQTAETRARELLDGRIGSVRKLVQTRQRIVDLREQLADAERDDVRAYQAALRDGWTADELRSLGVGEPDKAVRARRRTPRPASGESSTAGS